MDIEDNRWSNIPKDIMELILKRLGLADYIRSGAVCVSWRSFMREKRCPPVPELPWIMLSKHQLREYRSFYSLSEGRVYKLNLPEAYGASCRGSSMDLEMKHGLFFFEEGGFADVIFHKGLLYAISLSGELKACTLSPIPKTRNVLPPVENEHVYIRHLVESCGELLMVSRFYNHASVYRRRTTGFQVFKLNSSVSHWVFVESLGDHMLYMGFTWAKSLRASVLGFVGNCICYSDKDVAECGSIGYCIFYLENRSIVRYHPSDHHSSKFCLPFEFTDVWITPNLWPIFTQGLRTEERKIMDIEDNRWSNIPKDIMELILKRLGLADYIRSGAVCVSWRSFMREKRYPPVPELPWIMLSEHDFRKTRSFYSLSEGRVYKLNLPEAYGVSWCGSFMGWMIMTDDLKRTFLLNPFSRSQIQLPTKTLKREPFYIRKAILSSAPISDCNTEIIDWVVVAIAHGDNMVFCRPGDETWTFFPDEEEDGFADVIIHKGLLYAISLSGELKECTLSPILKTRNVLPPVENEHILSLHLVESCGELLMVSRFYNHASACNRRTTGFQVFKLDSSVSHWVSVESLGDHMLIMGFKWAKSLRASVLGFVGNCIFFSDKEGAIGLIGQMDPAFKLCKVSTIF
ncbi:uncharacterized protein LOC143880654 [Tasmannia lanceolata]|uniref:uncharacterized protein LOC143880654 n=1 Tax=Tasmannia lanceolata TaxID=3420 RepID=UPI004063D734